jgi:hypothetical protein
MVKDATGVDSLARNSARIASGVADQVRPGGVPPGPARRAAGLTRLFWQVVDSFVVGDAHAPLGLRQLRETLVDEEHPEIGFVVAAIEASLARGSFSTQPASGGRHHDRVAVHLTAPRSAGRPATCTRAGRSWRIEVGNRAAIVSNCVGVTHLAVLTAHPGVEIPAIDLVAGFDGLRQPATGHTRSRQPILDITALDQYQRQLSNLRAEIDDLETTGDENAATLARTERDWILRELNAATGLGGRARAFTDNGERARIAVGKAIRRVLTRIECADAVVGTHLRSSVHTGIRCWYRPS